jgi:hypothetical protein
LVVVGRCIYRVAEESKEIIEDKEKVEDEKHSDGKSRG